MLKVDHKVIAVTGPDQRQEVIRKVMTNYQLKALNDNSLTVQQDRINRIKIFEGTGDNLTLVQQITVVIVPITFSIEPLLSMTGDNTTFAIHLVLDKLEGMIKQLKELALNPSLAHVKRNRVDMLLKLHGLDGDGAGKKS